MRKQKRFSVLVREIYAKYPTGGALHIVLDDFNTSDADIVWCIDNIDAFSPVLCKEDYEMFIHCAGLLLSIKESRRFKAIKKAYKAIEKG